MRRCEDCKIILDDDVRHCPKCGQDLSPSSPAARLASSDVTSLLASANLHRIRAEWDEAVADCTNALRLDPRNPDIASLLGSIYEERGMLDEALVWFQMALELNPNSEPDQSRLERVTKLTEAKRNKKDPHSFHVFEMRTRLWAIGLGAIFVVIVAVAIITTLMKNRSPQSPVPRLTHNQQSQNYTPSVNEPGSSLPQHAPQSGSSSSPTTASAQGGSPVRTPGESYIRSELSTAQAITETGASIDDVIADPRSGVACVTFTVPFKGTVAREQIIRASVAVARKTFDLNREVKFVTVRCIVQAGSAQGTQIAFIGDAARQSIDALSPTATNEQQASAFSRPWWNPQMQGNATGNSSPIPSSKP